SKPNTNTIQSQSQKALNTELQSRQQIARAVECPQFGGSQRPGRWASFSEPSSSASWPRFFSFWRMVVATLFPGEHYQLQGFQRFPSRRVVRGGLRSAAGAEY